MTLDAGGSTIGAGWFPDPAGSPWLRWWDGAAWSDHFIDPATGAPPQVAAPAPTPSPMAAQASVAAEAPVAAGAPVAAQPVASGAPLTRRELREQQAEANPGQQDSQQPAQQASQQPELQPDPQSDLHAPTVPIAVVANFDSAPPFSDAVPVTAPFSDAAPTTAPFSDAAPTASPLYPVLAEPLVATPSAAAPSPFDELLPAQQPDQPQPDDQPQQLDPGFPTAPFAPTLAEPGFGQTWATAPPPKMEDAYFPPRGEQPYVPMVNPRASIPQAAQEVVPGAVSTVPIWLFAVLPVLHVALAWFVVEKLKLSDLGTLRWAIIAGPIVIYLILAAADRRSLLARGHVYLASALLAILPPLYIGIRAARMGVRAVPPAIVWLLLQAAGIAVLILLFPGVVTQLTSADTSTGATIQPQPTAETHELTPAERATLLTPAGMAAELKSEFASKGVTMTSVTCPQLPNTTDGTQVTCTGVLPISTLDIVVSVDNVNALAAFDIISTLPHQGN